MTWAWCTQCDTCRHWSMIIPVGVWHICQGTPYTTLLPSDSVALCKWMDASEQNSVLLSGKSAKSQRAKQLSQNLPAFFCPITREGKSSVPKMSRENSSLRAFQKARRPANFLWTGQEWMKHLLKVKNSSLWQLTFNVMKMLCPK